MVEVEGVKVDAEKRLSSISSVTVLFDAGSRYDPEGKEGLSNFTGEMLLRGTEELPRREFFRRVESLGKINIHTEADFIAATLTAEHKNMEELMELFFSAVISPAFSEEEIERVRAKLKGELNSIFNSPQDFVSYLLPYYLFPSHPYGHSPWGTPESIDRIEKYDIERFFSLLVKEGMSVGIVSPSPEREIRVLESFIYSWEKKGRRWKFNTPLRRDGVEVVRKEGISSSFIEMVFYLPSIKDLNEAALTIFNAIYGGSFTSRLVRRMRVEQGLAYYVHSYTDWREGFTIFRISTSSEKEDKVIEILKKEKENLIYGIDIEEFVKAKRFVIGNFPLKLERAEKVSLLIATRLFYGLEERLTTEIIEGLRRVTKEDMEEVIGLLSKESFILVLSPRD